MITLRVQSLIRSKASTSLDTTRNVVAESLAGLNQDILQRLSKCSTVDDNIQSKRRAGNPVEPNPQNLSFEIPERFRNVLLHDTGAEDPARILTLGSRELLHVLDDENVWLLCQTMFYPLHNSCHSTPTKKIKIVNKKNCKRILPNFLWGGLHPPKNWGGVNPPPPPPQ